MPEATGKNCFGGRAGGKILANENSKETFFLYGNEGRLEAVCRGFCMVTPFVSLKEKRVLISAGITAISTMRFSGKKIRVTARKP